MKDRRSPKRKHVAKTLVTSSLLPLTEPPDVRWGLERMQSAAEIDPAKISGITVEFFPATIGESLFFEAGNNNDLRESIRRLAKERRASSVFIAIPIELNGRVGVMFHLELLFASSLSTLFSMNDGEQWHEFELHTRLGRIIDAPI